MEQSLPKGYKKGVERVSNVVSHKFPFDNNSKARFLNWLRGHKISEEDYMEEATSVGTFVHLQLEKYLIGEEMNEISPLFSSHKKEIEGGCEYVKSIFLMKGKLLPEQIVKDKHDRYQGTIDLVRIDEKTKTVWLYDYKTWGIAKKRWNLPNLVKKNSDKLKKVALQLSLYAETYRQKGYSIGGIYAIWVHEEQIIEYNLFEEFHRQKVKNIRLWTTEEIEELLDGMVMEIEVKRVKKEEKEENLLFPYEMSLYINKKTMQVRVNTNIKGQAYTNAEITLENEDCEGMTPEDKIAEAIRLQKILIDEY